MVDLPPPTGPIRRSIRLRTSSRCPADFAIATYLDSTFRVVRGTGPAHRVRLRFAPTAARYVREKSWHPSQRLTEQPDGSLVLTLKLSHLLEVRRWAMSFGGDCEVLEPAELRRAVTAELRTSCDRVRIMPFLEGIATSVHGIVLPDGVVALRPVELVTLRRPGHRLVYSGCATFWDPPDDVREEMIAW